MTIEQAIEQTERAYKESRNGLQYALKRGETKFAERCKKEAEENRQLADWLRELQERRKAPEIIRCGECKHLRRWINTNHQFCDITACKVSKDEFCNKAERKTDND